MGESPHLVSPSCVTGDEGSDPTAKAYAPRSRPQAVGAVKLGAVDYLAKPADADDVTTALLGNKKIELPENPMSADRVRWEHIQRIYELSDRNVSGAARRLGMHRRTLQRILRKRAPK